MLKRIFISVFCVILLFSGTTAAASTFKNTTTASDTFNVTVPLSLPIRVDRFGEISTDPDLSIVNNSTRPVIVSNVTIVPLNHWSAVSFYKDFSKAKVDIKEFGMLLNGDSTDSFGNLILTPANWGSIPCGGFLPINYQSNVSVQSEYQNTTIATVVFTICFDPNYIPQKPATPYETVFTYSDKSQLSLDIEGTLTPTSYSIPSGKSLKKVAIGNGVTSISDDAFYKCSYLESVTFSKTIQDIGIMSFASCPNLTHIEFYENSNMIIGDYAFAYCPSLRPVYIPSSISTIKNGAFWGTPHIFYTGTSTGSPWGANAIN